MPSKLIKNMTKKELIDLLEIKDRTIIRQARDLRQTKFAINNIKLRMRNIVKQINNLHDHPFAKSLTKNIRQIK